MKMSHFLGTEEKEHSWLRLAQVGEEEQSEAFPGITQPLLCYLWFGIVWNILKPYFDVIMLIVLFLLPMV